jgi:hypothetical protein
MSYSVMKGMELQEYRDNKTKEKSDRMKNFQAGCFEPAWKKLINL